MKRLFLDSANLDEIRQFVETDAVQGVTTNPSLMAKEKKGDYHSRIHQICEIIQVADFRRHLSVEVTTLVPEEMHMQACNLERIMSCYPKIVGYVKIPVMLSTLSVITRLVKHGVRVNATACMTAYQAKLAHDAGAQIVSFFYNRMVDGYNLYESPGSHRHDALEHAFEQISEFDSLKRNSEVICGSIRRKEDVLTCWSAGADIVTVSAKIITEMVEHPQTTKAIRQFQEDIDKWLV